MQTVFDAIIVGAGPAGASAAILLANAGWSVCLIEKQTFPRRKVCGECVAASNLPLLDALGVGADFMRLAGPALRRVALMHGARTVMADLPAAPAAALQAASVHPWGHALGRETLDALLVARARALGVAVLQPASVLRLGGAPGQQRCTVRDGATGRLQMLRSRVAILAHGSWEPLPAARAVQRLARNGSDLLAFKATFEGASLAAGLLPVLAFEGGYGGLVLADRGQLTLACCIRADRLDALRRARPGLAAGDVVQAMLQRACVGVAQALYGASRCGGWLASGPLRPGVRLRADDTVFRIGNAAGEAHPIIGEGISMALQSAWLLCDALLSAVPGQAWHADVATRYTAAWRRHFVPRLRLAAVLAHLTMRPATASALLTLVARWPALLTQVAVFGGKLRCAPDAATVHALAPARGAPKQHTTIVGEST